MLKTKDKNYSIILLYFIFFGSMLPTLINNTTLFYGKINKTIIWCWDIISLCIYLFILILMTYKTKNKIKILSIVPGLIFVVMQFFAYIQSNVNNLYMVLPIAYFIHYLYANVLINNLEIDNKKIIKFLDTILYFAMFLCIYNIIVNYKYMLSLNALNNKYIHISSLFSHRNSFGQFLFIVFIINTLLYDKTKNKRYIYFGIMFAINLFYTFSRTSICTVAIFFIILYFTKCNTKKELLTKILICIVLILVFMLIISNESIVDFLEYYVLRIEDGTSGRDTLWKMAFNMLNGGRIFLGYGLGSSVNLLAEYSLTNTHNSYIEMLISGGLIYLISMLIYLIILTRRYYINWKKGDKSSRIFFAAMIAFAIYMLFEKILLFGTGYAPTIITLILVVIPHFYKDKNITG